MCIFLIYFFFFQKEDGSFNFDKENILHLETKEKVRKNPSKDHCFLSFVIILLFVIYTV